MSSAQRRKRRTTTPHRLPRSPILRSRHEDSVALLGHRRLRPRPRGRRTRDHHAGRERPALRAGATRVSAHPGCGFSSRETFRSSRASPHPSTLTSSPQVLQHHFPGRELHRDVANIHDLPPETELLVAGFPCPVRPQPLSFVPVSTIFLGREDVARRKRRIHRDDVSYPRRLFSAHPPTARQSPPK